MRLLKKTERVGIIDYLKDRFDFSFPKHLGMAKTNGKIWIFPEEVLSIELEFLSIETIGLYFGVFDKKDFRLSFEGASMVGRKAKKNVANLNDEQAEKWMRGSNIETSHEGEGYVIIRHDQDILGCGKYINNKIINFVSKRRRLKVS